MTRECQLTLLIFTVLLSACGGGGTDPAPSPTPTSGTTPPVSQPGPAVDHMPPTVSASATVSADAVTFTAMASDDVAVTAVSFVVDDGAIKGTVQKSPGDGSYSLQIPSNLLAVGDHSGSALASDAAGNSATSAPFTFTIGSQPAAGPDTTAPTITAAVEGNFGLVKLTAIAKDNVRVDGVDFMVDGKSTGYWASPAYISNDPADQYFARFDATGLANGPHVLTARAMDRSNNVTNSAPVTFNVDSSAGLIETAANETIATATPVQRSQLQIAGTLVTVTTVVGTSKLLRPDSDYYRISLAAGETVGIDMLSTQGFFLSVVDANGTALSKPSTEISSDVSSTSYTNGSMPQDVYIEVTSIPYDFQTHNQYKLTLKYM
jgi:hypothetical protein